MSAATTGPAPEPDRDAGMSGDAGTGRDAGTEGGAGTSREAGTGPAATPAAGPAAAAAPDSVRPAAAAARAGLAHARLLRLELRHNAMVWLLPVALGLFWLTTYRKDMSTPPMWNLRSAGLQSGAVLDFVVPVTGAAAWTGSRDARHRVADSVAVTARPRWARLLTAWAATTLWALAAYAVCVAVVYGVTARQAAWGGPLWWPAVVAAASLPAFSALGFAAGTFLPSRFTAPLAAVAAFFVLALTTELIHGSQSAWQITPLVTGPWDMGPQEGVATFYPFVPDLCVAQTAFLAAVTVALLAALALPAGAGGRAVRATAAGLTCAAVLVAGTAVWLAGTGTMGPHGMIDIPDLHDAASDRPLRFTPVCSRTAIPVCVNPAYAGYLPATAHALAPLLGRLAGLPGAPTRLLQGTVTYAQGAGNGIDVRIGGRRGSGTPTLSFVLPGQLPQPSMTVAQSAREVAEQTGPEIVARVVGYGEPAVSDAQKAVAQGLLTAAGLRTTAERPFDGPGGREEPDAGRQSAVPPGTPADAAARRFAALPAAAGRAWLVDHLDALRAGRLTLAELP